MQRESRPRVLNQDVFIAADQALGFGSDAGVCAGLIKMWKQLLFVGKEPRFFEYSNFLADLEELNIQISAIKKKAADKKEQLSEEEKEVLAVPHLNLANLIQQAKEEAKARRGLSEQEKIYIDMQSFFEGLEMFLFPEKYKDAIGKRMRYLSEEEISRLVASKELEARKGLVEIYKEPRMDTEQELLEYFEGLRRIFLEAEEVKEEKKGDFKAGPPLPGQNELPIGIEGFHHYSGLRYNKDKDNWIFVDANKLSFEEVERKDIAKRIMKSFVLEKVDAGEKYAGLNITIDTTGSNTTDIAKRLKKFRQENIASLSADKARRVNNRGMTLAHLVARYNHHDMFPKLQEYKVDLNKRNIQGMTPLHYAVNLDHLESAAILINGKSIQTTDNEGYSALQYAAMSARPAIIQLLIDAGADPQKLDQQGGSIAHCAASNGHDDLFPLFEKLGVNLNQKTKDDETPLMFALAYGQVNAARYLLDEFKGNINEKDIYGTTLLHYAVRGGREELVQLLLDRGANRFHLDNGGNTLAHVAAKYGRVDLFPKFEKVLNCNQKNGDGKTPLMLAAQRGHVAVAQMLLEKYADNLDSVVNATDNEGCSVLFHAVKKGRIELIWLLINSGAKVDRVDSQGNSIANLVAEMGDAILLNKVVARLAIDPNQRNLSGATLLMSAAQSGSIPFFDRLVQEYKIDVNEKDKSGATALFYAVKNNHVQLALHLINKYGLNPNQLDNEGNNIAHIAAQLGHANLIASLPKGVDINQKNLAGQTPLMIAAEKGQYDAVMQLIGLSANYNETNNQERAALHYAVDKGHPKVVLLLIECAKMDLSDSRISALPLPTYVSACNLICDKIRTGTADKANKADWEILIYLLRELKDMQGLSVDNTKFLNLQAKNIKNRCRDLYKDSDESKRIEVFVPIAKKENALGHVLHASTSFSGKLAHFKGQRMFAVSSSQYAITRKIDELRTELKLGKAILEPQEVKSSVVALRNSREKK